MKISRKNTILRRVTKLRKAIKVNTQKIRKKTLNSLQEIFNLAVSIAKGEIDTQTVEGVQVRITIKERQLWARVAAYIAQVMNSIAEHFDERELDIQLSELEKLVNEAKAKAKDRKTQEATASN